MAIPSTTRTGPAFVGNCARHRCRHAVVLVLMLALAGACSETRLKSNIRRAEVAEVDDQLTISGSFCTSPAADVSFPVKVMFIVDGSGSQQFTDQNRQRVAAVEETINALVGTGNTFFKIIVFNASVRATPSPTGNPPPPVFSNDINVLFPALTDLGEADTVTDYQGALGMAYSELLRDMENTYMDPDRGLAELARTKYVVVMISDGLPDPQCQAGLGNDFTALGAVRLVCEDQGYLNCILEEEGTDCFRDGENGWSGCGGGDICRWQDTTCCGSGDAGSLFRGVNNTELAAGNDYNQPYQVLQKIDDIMELQERFEVGEIRIHSALVLDPNLDPAIMEIFGDPAQAAPLMEEIANAGHGRYLEFYGGDQIDFLDISFASVKQSRVIRSFYAVNAAARLREWGTTTDSDFDGLDDDVEFDVGTDPKSADTDGDGYGDFLEWTRRAYSFDPLDPCQPPVVDIPSADPSAPCDPTAPVNCAFDPGTGAYADFDRDGLHDCEERQLGTDPASPDTDRDGLPDWLDFTWGLDPRRWDYERDDDQDNVSNGLEVEWHLNPRVQQSEEQIRDRYRYDRPETLRTIDGRPCYDFEVRNLSLVYTPYHPAHIQQPGVGFNEIRLFISENMADDIAGAPLYRVACVRPRYIPPSFKDPAEGRWVLQKDDFKYYYGEDPIFNTAVGPDDLFDEQTACSTTAP